MDKNKIDYYLEMLRRNRLIPLKIDNNLRGIVTFFIGNGNPNRYRGDQWEVIDDEPDGDTCYIQHLWTDKNKENPRHSLRIWHQVRNHIFSNFSNVRLIRWNRWRHNRLKIYKEEK